MFILPYVITKKKGMTKINRPIIIQGALQSEIEILIKSLSNVNKVIEDGFVFL